MAGSVHKSSMLLFAAPGIAMTALLAWLSPKPGIALNPDAKGSLEPVVLQESEAEFSASLSVEIPSPTLLGELFVGTLNVHVRQVSQERSGFTKWAAKRQVFANGATPTVIDVLSGAESGASVTYDLNRPFQVVVSWDPTGEGKWVHYGQLYADPHEHYVDQWRGLATLSTTGSAIGSADYRLNLPALNLEAMMPRLTIGAAIDAPVPGEALTLDYLADWSAGALPGAFDIWWHIPISAAPVTTLYGLEGPSEWHVRLRSTSGAESVQQRVADESSTQFELTAHAAIRLEVPSLAEAEYFAVRLTPASEHPTSYPSSPEGNRAHRLFMTRSTDSNCWVLKSGSTVEGYLPAGTYYMEVMSKTQLRNDDFASKQVTELLLQPNAEYVLSVP